MSTKTVFTEHGDLEYETVECDSCGNEVMEGEEISYVLGDIKSMYRWSYGVNEVKFNDEDFHKGTLCPYCADVKNIDIACSNSDSSSPTNIVSKIIGGVRNAHKNYVESMVKHLNADDMMGPYGEPDIVAGMIMLASYICVIAFVIILFIAFVL